MQEPRRWRDLLGTMRVRILATAVVLLAGSSLVSIALLRGVLLERLEEEITANLQREAEEFEILYENGVNPRTGEPFGDDFEAVFDTYFAREVPDEGETLLAFLGTDLHHTEHASDAVPANELSDPIAYWLALDEREEGLIATTQGDARYVALPIREGDQDALFVAANFPAFERDELNNAILTQALIQFGTIVLASVIGWFLAGRVLRPLRELTDTAQRISATDLTRRIPVRGDDEASRIAATFNDMLARLEGAFATQRRFLDEASHEFRAPLTVIRGHMDLLEMEADPQERAETTDIITAEIERMNRMVEDLLTLARAERPDFLTPGSVDLGDWTQDMFRKASVLCAREWTLESVARGTIKADVQRLTQAVMQLAENACQHTGSTGSVRLGSRVDGDIVRLWVRDDGPGVRPEDAERIFQRFVRGDGRRTGSGLGLSIVAAIAEAHGGQARLVPHAARGAWFEIRLPAVETATRRRPPADADRPVETGPTRA